MLSNLAVKNAKPRSKQYKLSDSGGLYLLVTPKGHRYWRMDYRFGGKRRTLALGVYPTISLAEARDKRDEAKKLLADGKDPSLERRIRKLTSGLADGTTFQEIAEEWLERQEAEGLSEATLSKKRWLLSFAYSVIGPRAISDISIPELLAVLRIMEQGGRHESARRLKIVCGQVFRYAIATGRAERDITADLKGALITPNA